MKLLFVCNQNKHRSKTAQEIFSSEFETRSAGLYGGDMLSEKDLKWADIVFVMEDAQRKVISEQFPKTYLQKKILDLDVPDRYTYQQEELIKNLRKRFSSLQPLF